MFFLSAKPLVKDEFLTVYKEAVLLSQLLFAPFGLSDATVDTLGQQNALQLYTSVFQQFEDLVSKRIFSIRGFDDDRIIASMHEYVGENQDQEVVKEMQAATTALQNMLTGPKVVEFDFSEHKSLPASVNVASAATAALLLSQVLTALVPTLYGKDYVFHDGEYYCQQSQESQAHLKEASLFNIDADTLKQIQVRVPLSAFSPTCSFSKAPFNKVSLRCKDSVNALLAALTLSVAELKGNPSTGVNDTERVHFSLQQYHALLDLYGDSAEVKAVLQRFIGGSEDTGNAMTVANVRDSLALSSLNLSSNPTVSYINQLTHRLHALVAAEKASKEGKVEGEEEEEATLGELETVSDALELACLSIERRHAAAQCALAQEYTQAVTLLSEDLLDLLDDEEKEEGKEVGDEVHAEEEFLLPTHIKVYLWTERATYLLESGDAEGALKDVNRAISLNNQYAPAYSLRAKLRMQKIAEQQEENEEEEEGKEEKKEMKEEEKVEALQSAAEDALLAFLLDGSSDLALAAAAEEAAREACRLSAKNIFKDRKTTATENSAVVPGEAVGELRKDNFPRSWLVGSYFGAYTQLSTSLSLYKSDNTEDVAGAGSAIQDAAKEVTEKEESDNLCDIDEDVKDVVSLPAVPSHLLNTVVVSTETTYVDGAGEDSAEKAPVKCVAHCEKDREAYSLLLCLTELMESITHDSVVNAHSSNVPTGGITSRATSTGNIVETPQAVTNNSDPVPAPVAEGIVIDRISTVHQRDVTHTSVTSTKKKTVRSVAFSLLAFAEDVGLDALAMAMGSVDLEASQSNNNDVTALSLVEEGVCSTRADPEGTTDSVAAHVPSSSSSIAATPAEVRVEACRHYRAALSLLCGAGWTGLGAGTDNDVAGVDGSVSLANSLAAHLRDAVGLMDADAVYSLTGVRFNADGSIAAIQPGPVSSTTEDARKQAADGEEDAESSESEYSEGDHHYGEDYCDDGEEDPNAFGNHSYGAKRGGQTGGDYGFHFGGQHGGYHGENDEDFDYSEENSQDDEEEEETEEGSDWETVGSSEEESVHSEAEEHKEEVKPVKVTKKSATAAGGAAFAKAFKAGLSSGSKSKKPASNSREDEVAAALKEIEKQMERHHLEMEEEEEEEEEEKEDIKEKEQVGESALEDRKSISELQSLPTPVPPSAPVVDTVVEGAEESDEVLPPPPPSPPAAFTSVANDVVVTATPPAETIATTPVVVPAVEVVIDVSHALRARLLNLCGSLAYLAGDAVGAVQCFRTSLQFDPLLLDSQIKLGSLLVDMDEMKEASKLLKSAHKKAPHNYIALLHLAEMHTHDNNFDEAVHLLRKARRLAESEISDCSNQGISPEEAAARAAILIGAETVTLGVSQAHIAEYARRAKQSRNESLANIISLLGINLFRQLPSRPEVSLHVLQSALDEQFKVNPCPILLLCCGEVYSQAGDMVTALECFRKAQSLAPNNPLCYVNAARTYQQLNQVGTAERHLQAALLLDPAMAMVRVDLAQNLLLSGHAAHALQILDEALYLARQVSEIRDVLTARTIASMQVSLEERGLYCSSGARIISN